MLFSNARQELLILEHEHFLPQLVQFCFCSCFPSTLVLILQYKARSLRWAALLASTCSISFFVLVFPLPSFSFSRNAHCGASFDQKRSLFMISLCFPYALALVFNCDAICDQWAPMLASTRSFLTFSFCFPSTIAQVYTQALDQKENKPRPRAKSQGPKAKGKGPKQEGQEPKQKGQGKRAKNQGKRAKAKGPRTRAKGPRAKGKGPREKGQEPRGKGQEPKQKGKRAKGK